jgi:hypothetical protein
MNFRNGQIDIVQQDVLLFQIGRLQNHVGIVCDLP